MNAVTRVPGHASADQATVDRLARGEPTAWRNPARTARVTEGECAAIATAGARMERFAPELARLFFALRATGGHVESPLLPGDALAGAVGFPGNPASLFIKADHLLPVAGSVKARGGSHAVLEIAERIAGPGMHADAQAMRRECVHHEISVGSTGNLGLSIGLFAAALGFRTVVHMSSHAKAWKQALLREQGVRVVEHAGDYSEALASARLHAAGLPRHHFIDDEASEPLLYGYATAAAELASQLAAAGRTVDRGHPLFVYLPCGVGGAPAGISLGLNAIFGRNVHCFYVEPTEAPCMVLALIHGSTERSIYDIGLSGLTTADGLAVPRASALAAAVASRTAAGMFTVRDATLLSDLQRVYQASGLRLEPSATAGFEGARHATDQAVAAYLEAIDMPASPGDATHVVWATGGASVPDREFAELLAQPSHSS
jgi:D-serine dehydratase